MVVLLGLGLLVPAQPAMSEVTPAPAPTVDPVPAFDDGAVRRFVNAGSGRCLDVPGASRKDDVRIQQWDCNGSDAQDWRFERLADGFFAVANAHSGKCLSVSGSAAGAASRQVACERTAAQSWRPVQAGDAFQLVSKATGHCLAAQGGSAEDGESLAQEVCAPGDAQKWTIVEPAAAPTEVRAVGRSGRADVAWTPPADDRGAPITGYVITVRPGGRTVTVGARPAAATVTGLSNGTVYTFRVAALTAAGPGAVSEPSAEVTPRTTPPAAPALGTVTPGDRRAVVTWSAPADDGGAAITRYRVTATPGGRTVTTSGTSATITRLDNGTAYTFSVSAINRVGAGVPSASSAPVTPMGSPDAPERVVAVAGDGRATVTWSAPASTGGTRITRYTVTASPGGKTVTAAGTSAVIMGLANGTAYTFTVTAANSSGTGPASRPSAAVTPIGPPPRPGAPSRVTATGGNGRATVTWTAPPGSVTRYTVTASPGGKTVTASGTSATIAGLTNGTAYTFTVTAANSSGTGPASEPSTAVVPATLPGMPTAVTASAGDRQATVTWAPPAHDGGSRVTRYTVTTWPGGKTLTTPNAYAVVPGLTRGTAYTFTVRAANAVGAGATSAATTPVTPFTRPPAPRRVAATAGDGRATLTWSAPAAEDTRHITGYTVTAVPGGTTISVPAGRTSATVTGLVNGRRYRFTVRAELASGTTAESTPSNEVTPASLPGPVLWVSATSRDRAAEVTWHAPLDDGGSPVTSYRVSAPGVPTLTVSGTTTAATVTGLTNGTSYVFTVTPTNATGAGPGKPASAVTPRPAPQPPTDVTATAGNGQVRVYWEAPDDTGGGPVTTYTVTAAPGGATKTAAGTASTMVFDNLVNGTAYTFTVTASNTYGTSAASTPSAAVTPVVLAVAPTAVTAQPRDGGAAVSWTAPANNGAGTITSYRISANGKITTVAGDTTSTVVTGLKNGVPYSFTVTAVTAAGSGAESEPSPVVVPSAVPGAPQQVSAVAGITEVVVNWSEPDTGGAPITQYTVRVSPGGRTVTVPGSKQTTEVTGLVQGTAYTFTVSATNAAGTSAWSAASTPITPAGPPSAPASVTATAGNAQARVSWTAPSSTGGAALTNYTVTASPGGASVAVPAGQTQVDVTGLTNGTNYTFTVTATNSAGTGAASAPSAAVKPTGAPYPPTAVTATPGNGQATVQWTAPGNGGSAITGYTVTASPGGRTATATTTSATVTGLTNGTAYTFTVKATSALGTSIASGASTPVTPAAVPGAPTGVTATAGDTKATVQWTAPAVTGGSAITGYTVTATPGGRTATSTGTSATVTGLTNGTSYTFTVKATNTAATGAASAASNAVIPVGAPGAPVSVAATSADGRAQITWQAPAGNGGSPVTSYRVIAEPGHLVTTATGTSATVSGLTNGTTYTITVEAVNAAATGPPSAPVTVIPARLPGRPTQVTATTLSGQATVTWSEPADTGGAAITRYTVTASPGGRTATATGRSATVTGLTNGTAYTFTVTATNPAGTGAASDPSAPVTPAALPGAPKTVTATTQNGEITLSWQPPDSSGGAPVTGYNVASTPDNATFTTSNTTATITGLRLGTSYTFTVAAINAGGSGPLSAPSNAVTPALPPGAPQQVQIGAGSTQAVLSWQPPQSNGGLAISSYTATAIPDGSTCLVACPSVTVGGTARTAQLTGLTSGTAYTFKLHATNAAGDGAAWSTWLTVTPGAVPGPPQSLQAWPKDGGATVRWAAPQVTGDSPITHYRVTAQPGGQTVMVDGNTLQTDIPGLDNNTDYTFTVAAINAAGPGLNSAPSIIVTPGRHPSAPTRVVAATGDGAAGLTWSPSPDSGTSPVEWYAIVETRSRRTIYSTGDNPSVLFTGLTNGTPYAFQVYAWNRTGWSSSSPASEPVIPSPPRVPGRALVTATTPGDRKVTVRWSPPDTGAASVTEYQVRAWPGGTLVKAPGTARAAIVSGLTNGTDYWFSVTAVNQVGAGQESVMSPPVTPAGPVAPPQPQILSTLAGNGAIDVGWVGESEADAPITSYTLTAQPGNIRVTASGSATNARLTGLTNGTAYTVSLTARNSAGTSTAAVATAIRPAASRPPAPPDGLSVTVPTTGQARVQWAPPADTGTSAVTSYTVTVAPGGQTQTVSDCAETTCGLTWTGLDPAGTYTFTVTATNAAGTSLPSEATQPVTPTVTVTHEPKVLTAAAGAALTEFKADGTMVFTGAPPEVQALAVGDHFSLRPAEAVPRGFLGRVLSRSVNGDKLIIKAKSSALEEVLGDGDFSGTATLGAGDVLSSTPPATGARLLTGTGAGARAPEADGTRQIRPLVLRIDHDFGGGARASGTVAITPVVSWDFRMGPRPSAKVSAKAVVSGSVQVSASRAWGPKTRDIWLGHYVLFASTVMIGKVPVVITVELDPTLRLSGQAGGALQFSAKPLIEVGAQAQAQAFSKPKFTPIYQNHTRMGSPTLHGNASAELGLRLEIETWINGLASLEVVPTPYLRATADVNANPWWKIRSGATIQGCASFLRGLAEFCTPAGWADFGFTVAQAGGPFRGIKVSPERASTTVNRSVQFTDTPLNVADGPVQWSVVRGVGSIDQNGLYVSPSEGEAVVQARRTDSGVDQPVAQGLVRVGAIRPGAPLDVKAAAGPSSALVSWQPDPTTLAGITGYAVVTSPATTTVYTHASSRSVRLSGLSPGQAYSVQVYALSGGGMSDPSAAATVIPTQGIAVNGDAVDIAVDAAGNPDNTGYAGSLPPFISGDGRYAFFVTRASSNLMPPEVYQADSQATYLLRKNLETGEIDLASVGPDGHTPIAVLPVGWAGTTVSTDGNKVGYFAFDRASGSLPDRTGTQTHIIVHDLATRSVWTAADGFVSDRRTNGPHQALYSMSADGKAVLYPTLDQDADSTESKLIRQQQGGPTTVVDQYLDNEHGAGSSYYTYGSGGDMSGDGQTIVWSGADPVSGASRILRYDVATAKKSVAVERNAAFWPHISRDGSTLAYNAPSQPTGSVDHSWAKKMATGPQDPGVVYLQHCSVPVGMSAGGRYIAYGGCSAADGTVNPSGIYDSFGGNTLTSGMNLASMSDDGARTLSTQRDLVTGGGGVWLQKYTVDGKDPDGCNEPDYGYIGDYERRSGIRVKLCNDADHRLNFGNTNADSGIRPPGWPEANLPASLNVPASWPTKQVYRNGSPVFARGHLYGAVLGGSNTDDRNFITQFSWSNSVLQNGIEVTLRNALKAQTIGQVYYYVTPVYSDLPSALPDPTPDKVGPQGWAGALPSLEYAMPNKIHIVAISTTGLTIDACVPNTNDQGGQVLYDDPCLA